MRRTDALVDPADELIQVVVEFDADRPPDDLVAALEDAYDPRPKRTIDPALVALGPSLVAGSVAIRTLVGTAIMWAQRNDGYHVVIDLHAEPKVVFERAGGPERKIVLVGADDSERLVAVDDGIDKDTAVARVLEALKALKALGS